MQCRDGSGLGAEVRASEAPLSRHDSGHPSSLFVNGKIDMGFEVVCAARLAWHRDALCAG